MYLCTCKQQQQQLQQILFTHRRTHALSASQLPALVPTWCENAAFIASCGDCDAGGDVGCKSDVARVIEARTTRAQLAVLLLSLQLLLIRTPLLLLFLLLALHLVARRLRRPTPAKPSLSASQAAKR